MKFLSQKNQPNKQKKTNKQTNKQTKEHFVEILYRIKNDCAIHFYSKCVYLVHVSTIFIYLPHPVIVVNCIISELTLSVIEVIKM